MTAPDPTSYIADPTTVLPTAVLPTAPDGTHADPTPALAGIMPEQTPDDADGVDLTDLPAFRSMTGQLPSARFHLKAQLIGIQQAMPASWTAGETPDDDEVVDNIDAVDALFARIEGFILDRAADRDAMTAWLCNQDNGEQALMAAFGTLAEQLGN